MKKLFVFFLILMVSAGAVLADVDVEGSRDHQMFTRMTGFYIDHYETNDFSSMDFLKAEDDEIQVEGHYTKIVYVINEDEKVPGELEILRNFENATAKIGGKTMYSYSSVRYIAIQKDDRKVYLKVYTADAGGRYTLEIIEEKSMVQTVTADATSLFNSIQSKGSVAVGGILFDFNKSTLKPESAPAIDVLVTLLKNNPQLKLYVVGHTDNVGSLEPNLTLSQARAEAVVQELVSKHGVAPTRLKAKGLASLAPVASNRTEDGRTLNRRVELVEQ